MSGHDKFKLYRFAKFLSDAGNWQARARVEDAISAGGKAAEWQLIISTHYHDFSQ